MTSLTSPSNQSASSKDWALLSCDSIAVRLVLWLAGLALFCTNPFRDLWFYQDIAAHEGFDTTSDVYVIGFANQLVATIVFFPVAFVLIGFGICFSRRMALIPRLDRFTYVWGIISSLLAVLMLDIEFGYVWYSCKHLHHLDTLLISMAYIGFIYFWWCCSLSHGPPRKKNASQPV